MQMLELADRDIKTITTAVFHMFKKLRADLEDIRRTHLDMKATLSEMKYTLDGINNQSRDYKKQLVNFKTPIETRQKKTHRERKNLKINRPPVSNEAISSSLI